MHMGRMFTYEQRSPYKMGELGACCTCGYFCILMQKYPDFRAPLGVCLDSGVYRRYLRRSAIFCNSLGLKRARMFRMMRYPSS
jgi:hypothetical protein